MSEPPPALVDARGMRCPWPALRLARALREVEAAILVADDPAAPREVALLAAQRGWTIAPAETAIGAGLLATRASA